MQNQSSESEQPQPIQAESPSASRDDQSGQKAEEKSLLNINLLSRFAIFLFFIILHPGLWLSENDYYFKLKGMGGTWLLFTLIMLFRPNGYITLGLFGTSVILSFQSSISLPLSEQLNSLFSFVDIDHDSYSLWVLLLGFSISEILIYFKSKIWTLVDRVVINFVNTYFLCAICLYIWFIRQEITNAPFDLYEHSLLKLGSLICLIFVLHKSKSIIKLQKTGLLEALSMILVSIQVFLPLMFSGIHKQLLIYPLKVDQEAINFIKSILLTLGLN